MAIYRYEELGENQMDVFREIGSIGNGNAITALSGILSEKISMELPEVNILEFNMAQNKIGDAEEIVVGNIMLSSYISALSSLTGIQIHLSVPQFAVNMLGGILSMPMAMMGIDSDKIMMITGAFSIGGEAMDSNILLLPDIRSLNVLMKKLGVE